MDIREPQAPVEVAFYVPESNANTDPDGYMTNNVKVDNRGYIFAVDRNGAGMAAKRSGGANRRREEIRRADAESTTTARRDSGVVVRTRARRRDVPRFFQSRYANGPCASGCKVIDLGAST